MEWDYSSILKTVKDQPLNFVNGSINSPHTLLGKWLLILAGIKSVHVIKIYLMLFIDFVFVWHFMTYDYMLGVNDRHKLNCKFLTTILPLRRCNLIWCVIMTKPEQPHMKSDHKVQWGTYIATFYGCISVSEHCEHPTRIAIKCD